MFQMRAVRLFHSARRIQQHLHVDCIGNKIAVKNVAVIEKINEVIENVLGSKNDSVKLIREALKMEERCGISNILLTFELLRNGDAKQSVEIERQFAKLNDLSKNELLDKRENLLSSAAFAWHQGNYTTAGMLLETLLIDFPSDILAMRLAQECYQLAGLKENILGCIIRHPQTLYPSREVECNMLGMLSTGYLAQNRVAEAEEIAERAFNLAKGYDGLVFQALMSCSQLTGRSSEILNYLSNHQEKHAGTGLLPLLHSKGVSHVMRGNFIGTYRVLQAMVDTLVSTYRHDPLNIPSIHLSHLSFLLWNVYINEGVENMHLDQASDIYKFLLSQRPFEKSNNAISDVSNAMLLCMMNDTIRSGYYSSEKVINENKRRSDLLEKKHNDEINKPAVVEPVVEDSYFTKLIINFNTNLQASTTNPDNSADKDAIQNYYTELDSTPFTLTQEIFEDLKKKHYDCLLRPSNLLPENSTFSKIVPKISFLSSNSSDGVSDLVNSREHCSIPLTNALLNMSEGDYSAALETFAECNFESVFCGSVTQKDLIKQTRIEMYIRNSDWEMAKLLLRERTVLIPGDAQNWRKLGIVYTNLGELQLAKHAEYTAYQQGLGQGGFGANKPHRKK